MPVLNFVLLKKKVQPLFRDVTHNSFDQMLSQRVLKRIMKKRLPDVELPDERILLITHGTTQ